MSTFINNFFSLTQVCLSGVMKPSANSTLARPSGPISTEKQAQDEIMALRTELDKQKKRMVSPPETNANSELG
jgi:hypothetical protein